MKRYFAAIYMGIVLSIMFSPQTGNTQNWDSTTSWKAKDVIKILQEKYNHINDFTAELIQIQESEFTGFRDTTQLQIALLKEDYFKLTTSNIIVVTDGKIVTDFNIHDQIKTIDYLKKSESTILPREFLFEFPKKYSTVDFRREKRFESIGFTLEMEPNNPDEEIMQTLEVWIDSADSLVKYVHYTDINDNENIYLIRNYRIDTGLTPKDFELKIPEGLTVKKTIDLRKKKGEKGK